MLHVCRLSGSLQPSATQGPTQVDRALRTSTRQQYKTVPLCPQTQAAFTDICLSSSPCVWPSPLSIKQPGFLPPSHEQGGRKIRSEKTGLSHNRTFHRHTANIWNLICVPLRSSFNVFKPNKQVFLNLCCVKQAEGWRYRLVTCDGQLSAHCVQHEIPKVTILALILWQTSAGQPCSDCMPVCTQQHHTITLTRLSQ